MGAGCARGDRIRHRGSTARREATSAKQQRFQEQQQQRRQVVACQRTRRFRPHYQFALPGSARAPEPRCAREGSLGITTRSPVPGARARTTAGPARARQRQLVSHATELRTDPFAWSALRAPQRRRRGCARGGARTRPWRGCPRTTPRWRSPPWRTLPGTAAPRARRWSCASHSGAPSPLASGPPGPPCAPALPPCARPRTPPTRHGHGSASRARRQAQRSAAIRAAGPRPAPTPPLLAARALWRARARAPARAFEPNPNASAIKSH